MLRGNAAANALHGRGGADWLEGGRGNDSLDGGAGFDVAVYSGRRSQYTVERFTDGSISVRDNRPYGDGWDVVSTVEAFRFADGTVTFGDLPPVVVMPLVEPTLGIIVAGNGRANVLRGDAGDDLLKGKGGNDRLYGGPGNDTLYGGSGNDRLFGGDGNDKLHGGSGKDAFVLNVAPNRGTNKDRIYDFNVTDDTVQLDNAVFTKIGANGPLRASAFWSNNTGRAHDRSDRIIYDKNSGVLYYDPDGTGPAAGVQIATISKNLALTYKDFFII
jgi:Ca2+-binding RTX toxin-like protein